MAEDNLIYAVDVASSPEELPALSELLSALDFPVTSISSYEDVDRNTGVTTVLCDNPQEQSAAQRRIAWVCPGAQQCIAMST